MALSTNKSGMSEGEKGSVAEHRERRKELRAEGSEARSHGPYGSVWRRKSERGILSKDLGLNAVNPIAKGGVTDRQEEAGGHA